MTNAHRRTLVLVSLALGGLGVGCSSSSTSGASTGGGDSGQADHDGGSNSRDASSGGLDARAPRDAGHASDVAVADAEWLGDAASPRYYEVINHCSQTIWAASIPTTTFPNNGIVEMAPGYSFKVGVDNGWSGRMWGKEQCTTTDGTFACAVDPFPSSLAELTLTNNPDGGLDFYDVSLVDGFNLPIGIVAIGHAPDVQRPSDCGNPNCSVNLNATCPSILQDKVDAEVLACANDECKVLGDNDAASPACVYPNQYTEFFKTACPTAYSFPSDDPTSTFVCKGQNDYQIIFCP